LIPLFYFFICKLGPEYEGLETGVGHEMLMNSVVKSCGRPKTKVRESLKKTGDLGTVASESKGSVKHLSNYFKPKTATVKKEMTIVRVFDTFMKIAKTTGGKSVGDKTDLIMKLLMDAKPIETKYIIRWLEK
jgi:DNA ligase-1